MPVYEKSVNSIFINGEWKAADSGEVQTILNPATLEAITAVSFGGEKEALQAVQAAKQAFKKWLAMTGRERSLILYKASQIMLNQKERLAEVLNNRTRKAFKRGAW